MEKASEKKDTKKKNSKFKLMISVMLTVALFLVELYLMITAAANIPLIAGVGAGILIAASLVVSAVLSCVDEKADVHKELYDNIHKSEKASYVLLKKRLEALSKQVEALEHTSGKNDNSSAEVIKAQKSIAKVMMGKNKETQDRLFIELNNLEASLNDRVRELAKRLSGFQEEIERLADHIAKINTEAIQEAARGGYEVRRAEERDILEDSLLVEETSELEIPEEVEEEEFSVDDILSGIFEEESVEEPEPTPMPVAAPADDGGKMNQDDIAALIASMTGGDAAPVEEPEPEPIPTPVAAPADDGGKMNQDDIAALIASMTGGDAAPVEEPEPEPAPLPLSDDPNKMMTPEEIAALLASM